MARQTASLIGYAAASILLLLSGEFSAQAQVSFASAAHLSTGELPIGLAVADVNGDGRPDLLVVCNNSGTVSVLLGNGDGTLGGKTDYATGSGPASVAVGDLNGDGKLDLVVTNNSGNAVSVLLGTGGGTFGPKTEHETALGPSHLTLGDLNGDGKLDLVVANTLDNSISVLLGHGDGTFGPKTDYAAGPGAEVLALADLNRDGKLDLVVANFWGRSCSVFLGDGAGGLTALPSLSTGTEPSGLALADLNRDGKVDLVVTNNGDNSVSVFLGDGAGGFGAKTDFSTGLGPYSAALADLDGDGKLDLVVTNNGDNSVSVFLGDGAGGFGAKTDFSTGLGPTAVALGDLNRDGMLDIIVTNPIANLASVHLATTVLPPSGSFSPAIPYSAGSYPRSVAVGDLDRDGKLDVVVSNYQDSSVSVFLGDGAGGLGMGINIAAWAGPYSLALTELNGDGRLDLVVANMGSQVVSVFLGNGAGGFGPMTYFPAGHTPGTIALGDLNGDGKPDVVLSSLDSSTVSVFLGQGDGTFGARADYASGTFPKGVVLGDLNSDGRLDLVVSNPSDASVSVFLGNGAGGFGPKTDFPVGESPAEIALADFNRDGKLDLAVADSFLTSVFVLLGDRAGGFGSATEFSTGSSSYGIAVADFNRDGNLDIIVASRFAQTLSLLFGDGAGGFAPRIDFATYAEGITVGDMNRDGTVDLVAANPGGTVSVLLNGRGVPTVTITATDPTATEAGPTTGTFTVTRNGDATEPLTVYYVAEGGIPGTDFVELSGSVTIPTGALSSTITVIPIDDPIAENDEAVIVTLREHPSYALGTPSRATVSIVSDDPLPTVTITAADPTATEAGLTTGTFTVTRTGSTVFPITVGFGYGGTATVGVDYTVSPIPVTIPVGASSAMITITPIDDYLVEGNATVILTIYPSEAYLPPEFSYIVGSPSSATATIIDNDIGNDPLIEQQWHLKPRSQEPGGANVRYAWPSTGGAGVVIGIVDDGLQYTHPDLQANYVASLSWDFTGNDSDPSPSTEGSCDTTADCHGTAVAGVAAARGDNGIGVSGVAPFASLAGLRLIAGPISDEQVAAAVGYKGNEIHISNNSWGPEGSLVALEPLTKAAVEAAITQGRGGKGRVFVRAAGNNGAEGDNCNFDGGANSRFAITVGALADFGTQASYSEPCSALFVTAPSDGGTRGITTTDLVGAPGYDPTNYTSAFGGTSAATPLVSGVVALMLAENPSLTWRDVQHILARSAVKVNEWDSAWTPGTFAHNEKYGFGLVDAQAAASLASTWTKVPAESAIPAVAHTINQTIPDNSPTGLTNSIVISSSYADFRVEHVEVVFDAAHPHRGDLEVALTSPAGVTSHLGTIRSWDSGQDFPSWQFGSVRHWGEAAAGTWTLQVADRTPGNVGTWKSWTLRIFGAFYHALTVTKAGTGTGSVDSTPAGIDCGATCSASFGGDSSVTLTATPAAGSYFTGWSGGGCTGRGACTVAMAQARNVTATFTSSSYSLTVAVAGSSSGSVTGTPGAISCPSTCAPTYTHGTMVTLTAHPSTGAVFREWRGACSGTSATCQVTMNGAQAVTAVFSKVFTNDPLAARATPIKAVHFTELREAINALRAHHVLAAFAWTGTAPAPGGFVRGSHLTDLRTALAQAYEAAGRTPPTCTETIAARESVIKTNHLNELRTLVRALE